MRVVRKYSFVAVLAARSNLAYLSEVASRVVFLSVILYIFLRLWQLTFDACGTSSLAGFSLEQMLWYLTVTEAIMLSAPRVSFSVDQDVRSGAVAVQLLRPVSYPIYCLFNTLGERSVRFVMYFSVGLVVISLMAGVPSISPLGMLLFFLALPLAFTLDFLGTFMIGLGAFWLEDTSGIFLIYSRLVMILGGMLLPLELFPEWIRPILKSLPFSAILYGPAHQFIHPNLNEFVKLIGLQVLSIVAVGALVSIIWHLALRRVVVNGG